MGRFEVTPPLRDRQRLISWIQAASSACYIVGADLIEWVQQNVHTIDQIEAIHLSHMISAHGYLFPIDDHILTVKNDGTYYRFQTKCFWLSRCHEPDNTDYGEPNK